MSVQYKQPESQGPVQCNVHLYDEKSDMSIPYPLFQFILFLDDF